MALAGTVANTNLVPVWVIWNTANIGLCGAGDVTVTYTPSWTEKTAHQTGNYLLDGFFGGARVTVSGILSEIEEDDFLEFAFPMGEKQEDTDSTPNERFSWTNIAQNTTNSQYIGQRATTYAKVLELVPVAGYVTDATETHDNIVIPKALVMDNGDMVYSWENDLEIAFTAHALFDPAATLGENLIYKGLTTAGAGTWAASA